ncbi:hypothetical protein Ddye_016372 [Dipteronia dyeriana]|uniref:Exocyst component Exo84 C-terminal domain-containing protein n=1 Tax=Dipteronia dyeriana TaxID=168575 RepID=A0AAD9U796_9ROSI|nr:hypothetical protein Ddye_016372 [Dipteronia dyeriana]
METSFTSSRFRFRDHLDMENSTQPDTASDSDVSSVSSDLDHESEFQSMTAKGIKHLCSELVELKQESAEDFHRNIFFNYATFVRIFEEVESMENQLMTLKSQVMVQEKLLKGLIDCIYLKALSKQSIESIIEELVSDEPSHQMELEVHISNLSETLEILLAENRTDEAITILEMEEENFQRLRFDDDSTSDVVLQYNAAISKKKAMLTLQLTLVAENPRITATELRKTLVELCRLGDNHLATQLLIKYYHSRIVTGIHNLHCLKSHVHGIYTRELPKFVFSMVSQAARNFVMLFGETSPYASELTQWACEETEMFVAYFNKYVKLISELSGGLSTAVQSVQFATSFCSLLETLRLVLLPCLIKQMRPCLEEVLQIHVGHFKKVIGIFTATDSWVLGRYLVSGILNEGEISLVLEQQPKYCLLTNSGRKFITLLQAIAVDVTPLVTLEMEGSIIRGFMDLFTEYIVILERAIDSETDVTEKGCSTINLAKSLLQQVSVLANLSTLEHFFFGIFRSIFRDISQYVGFQQRELYSDTWSIQEANSRLKAHFCQHVINRMMSQEIGSEHAKEACINNVGQNSMLQDVMPSVDFQVLFLELRTLNKLAEDNVLESDWLMELLSELIEAIFVWISNNKHIWTATEEDLISHDSDVYNQFVLDIHFLVEIAKYGGYFSNDPSILVTLMNSALNSAGLGPERDVDDDGWANNAATEAIQKLLEIQKMNCLLNDKHIDTGEEHKNQFKDTSESFQDDDNIESSSLKGCLDLLEAEDSTARNAINLTDRFGELKDVESENAPNTTYHDIQSTEKISLQGLLLSEDDVGEVSEVRVSMEDGSGSELDAIEFVINQLEDEAEIELSGFEVSYTEDFVRLQDEDDRIIEEKTASEFRSS